MTDDNNVVETEDGDVIETPHAALINRLIAAADHDQDGGIMLTPDGHPLAAIWPTSYTDSLTGETAWTIHVLAADWSTTVETRHL